MASRHSRTGRRLAALERRFAVSDDPLPSRQDVLRDRIDRGNASLKEFAEFLGGRINAYRAMLITRSVYYALVRFHGWEPWAWRPQHVAASILGVPLGQPVPDRLLEGSSWMVDQPLRRPSGKGRVARMASNPELHKLWVQNQVCALALGAPDGRPLRTQMANGNWAGAIEYTMRHPFFSERRL